MSDAIPAPPEKTEPGNSVHSKLFNDVREAIISLPAYFRTETFISGVAATDIHTLNTVLGATIEDQVVQTLNSMRLVWDPNEEYALYSFVRQSQTFPDVRLQKAGESPDVLMGIELKGWYLLAKEGEPSFRYQVTPAACNPQDLIVVVPWVLSQVISGKPQAFTPYIESARYAAEYRNYHWQFIRNSRSDKGISAPESVKPYPHKADEIADRPASDQGGNFGRFARTGIMDTYLGEMRKLQLCGVRIEYWLSFLRAFQDQKSEDAVRSALERLAGQVSDDDTETPPSHASVLAIVDELRRLAGLDG
ncbi:hypothetical protein Pan97_52160 [Bremerella volcania]|uniref:Uncharacterized protein n=1 Tax=Bremerella volcania TaxID=2527984 RepID=A0A518CG40_9BACT|nr:hypothetical protein [Bremerella volcania]QDU78134.1 hypothetical protein Pan97_52160 [Bremerella volcania]